MPDARVLVLASYPPAAASTRYRVTQYVSRLAEDGIQLDVRPFLSQKTFESLYDRTRRVRTAAGVLAGVSRRFRDVASLSGYDAVLVQREAALIGPPLVEWFAKRRLPVILDLDDPTYVPRKSDVFRFLASALKWPGKTDQLIRWSSHVLCGNDVIAAHVAPFGVPATLQPTLVDGSIFVPRASRSDQDVVTIGWIGSHSTFPYVEAILPVLRRLAQSHRLRIRIIGSGAGPAALEGLDGELLPWILSRELADLQSFDVGIYPIADDEWGAGKSGLKAIQYMSCGIPYVASPVGVVGQIGVPGETHFEARTSEEWAAALARLIEDSELRVRMGIKARAYAVEHCSIDHAAAALARIVRNVIDRRSE